MNTSIWLPEPRKMQSLQGCCDNLFFCILTFAGRTCHTRNASVTSKPNRQVKMYSMNLLGKKKRKERSFFAGQLLTNYKCAHHKKIV